MGADDDVDLAALYVHEILLYLSLRNESGEQADVYREVLYPGHEVLIMLLSEKCRRREHYYLSAVHYGFEHRPEGNFGLAESDVAAKEPVHGLLGFHVCLYLLRCAELVISLNERESFFE